MSMFGTSAEARKFLHAIDRLSRALSIAALAFTVQNVSSSLPFSAAETELRKIRDEREEG